MKRIAFILILLATPAMAQDAAVEQVTVNGSSLAGIWRVSGPDYAAKTGFFSAMKWGPLHERFCRIAPQKDDLAMFCGGHEQAATVTANGDHIHFAWGTMMARIAIDGDMVSAGHMRGHFQIKLSGIKFEDPAFSDVLRVTPDPTAMDQPGKAALLRQIFEQGLASVPQDAAAAKQGKIAGAVPQLGAITAIAYLGHETKLSVLGTTPGLPDQPDFFSVYLVTFAQGERLCGLHQRADGVLDAFRCA